MIALNQFLSRVSKGVILSTTELYPLIDVLPTAEKFRLLQYLVKTVGQDMGFFPLDSSTTYSVWTPLHTPDETVAKLAKMLAEDKAEYGVQ